jgi:Zn-dependent protease/predicted transcriptional regulator
MFKNSVEVMDLLGFKVRIDPSWLLIAALIIWSLSSAYFPAELPGLSYYSYLALGTFAMLGLFASLILHELAHSLVARRYGLRVGNITLFIFGGVAELEQEPRSPQSEFWIAIAGPAMSLALAVIAEIITQSLASLNVSPPLTAVFAYLAWINLILALFNLVPAFPLDGGRVLRAVLWHVKQDVFTATRIASAFGSAFGYLLIALGVFSLFSASTVGGLWQILIGFFVLQASRSAYQQLLISSALKEQTVRELMTTNVHAANLTDTVQELVDNVVLKHNVSFVPVTDSGRLVGLVSLATLEEIDRRDWNKTRLSDVVVASDETNTVVPDTPTEEVFATMLKSGQRKLLVAEQGRLVGLLALSDLTTYLSIRSGLGLHNHPNGPVHLDTPESAARN